MSNRLEEISNLSDASDHEEDWQDAETEQQQQPTEQVKERKVEIDESSLRKKIKEIQEDSSLSPKDKAKRIQNLMSHGTTEPSSNEQLQNEIYSKSYHKEQENILGCKHYQRNCKLQANCCERIYTCRFCHDDVEGHNIVRHETKNMLCMLCLHLQPAAQHCRQCHQQMARYYCDKCKLWDNDPRKAIYHCDDCGICRQGKQEDFFHCKKCNICMVKSMTDHKCIERNLECDCPICGEYMFTSTTTVIFMPCGHCIHKHCYTAYIQTSYQCPTCLKSLGDMSEYFERLDKDLERQPMPPEYDKYISHIFCNDCEKKTPAKYHFFYHKCGHCGSFNTTVLKTENTEETARGESSNEQQPLEQAMQRPGMNHDRNTMAGPSSSRTNNPDSNEG
ncbi:zf-CHY-domain-containing protein [Rhizopus microsporus var. microsporus]|uniref:Zf-CHY-domain-containing protein n=2 Tax=Rhizopus microsporus TaxID=58291 RepID=A0A1X0QQD8_RHIZD|nr:zf-CHY-domain-containing protein [Rhizopus microsporus var. microsporus]